MPVTACLSLLVAVAHKRDKRGIKSVREREERTRENEIISFLSFCRQTHVKDVTTILEEEAADPQLPTATQKAYQQPPVRRVQWALKNTAGLQAKQVGTGRSQSFFPGERDPPKWAVCLKLIGQHRRPTKTSWCPVLMQVGGWVGRSVEKRVLGVRRSGTLCGRGGRGRSLARSGSGLVAERGNGAPRSDDGQFLRCAGSRPAVR